MLLTGKSFRGKVDANVTSALQTGTSVRNPVKPNPLQKKDADKVYFQIGAGSPPTRTLGLCHMWIMSYMDQSHVSFLGCFTAKRKETFGVFIQLKGTNTGGADDCSFK